jgi:hypothetical protein
LRGGKTEPLAFLNFLRQFAKLLGLLVALLDLQLCQLPRLLIRHFQNQSLKFDGRFLRVAGLFISLEIQKSGDR